MKLNLFLYELVDVLGIFPNLDRIKLVPEDDKCTFRAESSDPQFRLHAKTIEPVDGLIDVIGIPDIHALKNTFSAPGLNRMSSTVTYSANGNMPSFEISDESNNCYNFALFRKALAEEQIKVPDLINPPDYEVKLTPSSSGIALFKHWSNEMRKNYNLDRFMPFTNTDNHLVFRYCTMPSHHTDFIFSKNVIGTLDLKLQYQAKSVVQLLKHFSTSKSFIIQFSSRGLITVELKTTLAIYHFHFGSIRN